MANSDFLVNPTGEYMGSNISSARFPLYNLLDVTMEETERMLELVQAAMLQSLIERGVLKLGFITLKIKVDPKGRLYLSKKEPYVLENLLEKDEDPLGAKDFLSANHIKRLRLIKERHGNIQKDNSE